MRAKSYQEDEEYKFFEFLMDRMHAYNVECKNGIYNQMF